MNFGKSGFWLSIISILFVIVAIIFKHEYLLYPSILFIILSIIFGIISYYKKKTNNLESTNLSTIGIVLSIVIGLFLFVAVTSCLGCGGGGPISPLLANDSAIKLLKNCSQQEYKIYTDTMRFSEKYSLINKYSMEQELDVAAQNIFFYISKDLNNFSIDNDSIKYLGKSNLNVFAVAGCSTDKNGLLLELSQYVSSKYLSSLDGVDGEFNCHLILKSWN